MVVADFMTPSPLTVCDREPVEAVTRILDGHGIHHLPVVNRDNELVGIISDRDVDARTRLLARSRGGLCAADIMTRDVVVAEPHMPLSEAIDILSRNRFGALPVVVGRRVVGLLSTYDLLRLLQDILSGRIDASALLHGGLVRAATRSEYREVCHVHGA